MKRYIVCNSSSGTTQGLYETIGEALAAAVMLQDTGKQVKILDGQGSGAILVGRFDVLEAEGNIGRSLGSESMARQVPVGEIIESAKGTAPPRHIYHWDDGES